MSPHAKNRHTIRRSLVATVATMLLPLGASVAHADENAIILIDQSGSMFDASRPGASPGDPAVPKWQVARTLAKAFASEAHANRRYALWTFADGAYTQVVPLSAGASATAVISAIDALPPPGGATPLAKSLCDAVDELQGFEPSRWPIPDKRIYVLSDGLENSTPAVNQCHGPNSATNMPPFTAGSWQWKVMNKARTGNATSTVDPGTFRVIVDADALLTNWVPSLSLSFAAAPADVLDGSAVKVIDGSRIAAIPPIEILPPIKNIASIPITAPLVEGHPGLKFYGGLASASTGRFRQIAPNRPLPQLGDVNGDSCVDATDYQALSATWGQTVARGAAADLNRDRKVDYFDYLTMVQNFGKGCPK